MWGPPVKQLEVHPPHLPLNSVRAYKMPTVCQALSSAVRGTKMFKASPSWWASRNAPDSLALFPFQKFLLSSQLPAPECSLPAFDQFLSLPLTKWLLYSSSLLLKVWFPRTAALASPGNLLEMQCLRPHSRPTELTFYQHPQVIRTCCSLKAGICICFVHFSISSTLNNVWHETGTQ